MLSADDALAGFAKYKPDDKWCQTIKLVDPMHVPKVQFTLPAIICSICSPY